VVWPDELMRSAESARALFDDPQMKRSGVVAVMPAPVKPARGMAQSMNQSASPPRLEGAATERAKVAG
jgi:hypothetical protein